MPVEPLDSFGVPAAVALPRFLEVSHIARRLSTSQEFVRRLIREGRLPAIRMGTRYRVTERAYDAYVAACAVTQTRPDEDRKEPRRTERSA